MITLDSLGVTWLMIETKTGAFLCVIAVTCIDMLKSSSATWPWLSPNGAFGLEQLGIDQAFDDDLGIGRHFEIDGDALRHADRLAREPAGDAHLVEIDRRASAAR